MQGNNESSATPEGTVGLLGIGGYSSTDSEEPATPVPAAKKQLKVLHYNIYVGQGCDEENGGPELKKLENLAAWLKEQDADVVGLCECNGWQGWDVDTIKNALGYPHAAMGMASKPTRAHVMILSKSPMEVIEHPDLRQVYHHAFLHVKTAGVHFMETHLCPRHAEGRLKEINKFLPYIIDLESEPVLLMGDMNSIMPSSRHTYDEKELIATMRGTIGSIFDMAQMIAVQWSGKAN